jgi:hypothetical protein
MLEHSPTKESLMNKNLQNSELVPAVYTDQIGPLVGKKYSRFHTGEIVDTLREKGFMVTSSDSAKGKNPVIGKHMVRMRHESVLDLKDLVPEIIIINSHDGFTPLTLMSGMFRFICANGLIVGREDASIKLYHRQHNTMLEVMNAVDQVQESSVAALEAAAAWSKIQMDIEAQEHFTKLVGMMVRNDPHYFNRSTLLEARYDEPMNLWTTYNLAQESLTRGVETSSGRRTRGINNIRGNVNMNTGLWNIAEALSGN